MKENIKIGLLAVIAVTLIIQTYMQADTKPWDRGPRGISELDGSEPMYNINDAKRANPSMQNMDPSQMDPSFAEKAKQNPDFQSNINNTTAPLGKITTVNFKSGLHAFGKVEQNSENNHTFTFTNTGSEPLVIENAKGSCGCTVPTYPEEPIPPGGKGEIEVVYKPGMQIGVQEKTVTVYANTEPKETLLKITADVQQLASNNDKKSADKAASN